MVLLDTLISFITSSSDPQLQALKSQLINIKNANLSVEELRKSNLTILNESPLEEDYDPLDVMIKAIENYPQLFEALNSEAINDNSVMENGKLLELAIQIGKTEVAKLFLTVKSVRDNAAVRDNSGYNALCWASQMGNVELVTLLLEIEQVKNSAAGWTNLALSLAVSGGHAEVIRLLLKNEKVVNTEVARNGVLLEYAGVEAAKTLLENEPIRKKIAENNNEWLSFFINQGKIEIVKVLLAGIKSQEINLEVIVEAKRAGFDEIVALMTPFATIGGLPLNRIFKPEIAATLLTDPNYDLTFFSQNPREFINTFSVDSFVSPLVLPIFDIMDAHARVKDAERIYRQNSETAMSPRVLNAAKVAIGVAKEKYGEEYNKICTEAGGEKEGIEKIEQKIRAMILDRIRSELTGSTANIVRHFIDVNKRELITGKNKELMDQARIYFSSKTNNNDMAWRGYDKWAPVGEGWPNLLTENDELTSVYAAGIESGVGQMPIETVSLDARRRVAFYYLALIDDKVTTTLDPKTREGIFIGQLAEIRRAHNFGDHVGQDDPSCYPGTVGRIVDMGAGHPDLHVIDPIAEIPNIMRAMLAQHLEKMIQGMDEKEKEKLYWSMVALTPETLKAYLAGKAIETPILEAEWVALREKVIKELGNVDEVFQRINTELSQRENPKVRLLAEDEKVYVRQQLLDIAYHGVSLAVAKKYEPKAKEKTEEEEIEEVDLEDPFWMMVPRNALNRMQLMKGPDTESKLDAMRQYSEDLQTRERQNEVFKEIYQFVKNNFPAKEDQENAVAFFVKMIVEKQQRQINSWRERKQISPEILKETRDEFREKYKKILPPNEVQRLSQLLASMSILGEETEKGKMKVGISRS